MKNNSERRDIDGSNIREGLSRNGANESRPKLLKLELCNLNNNKVPDTPSPQMNFRSIFDDDGSDQEDD